MSIRQPWAELILSGRKTIETRPWRTSHRGPIAIHAGWIIDEPICQFYDYDPASLPRGGLIGTVEVLDVIEFSEESWRSLCPGHCVPDESPGGRVGWLLANPRRFNQLIPFRGLPGLFPLPPDVAGKIEDAFHRTE